jgi:vesicle-associated membrane protein 7
MGKIEYAVVARGAVVLAEHGAAGSNAGAVARQVLERLPDGGNDCNVSYTQDLHVFHVKRTDGITALCMADDAAGRKCPFHSSPSWHAFRIASCLRRCHGWPIAI